MLKLSIFPLMLHLYTKPTVQGISITSNQDKTWGTCCLHFKHWWLLKLDKGCKWVFHEVNDTFPCWIYNIRVMKRNVYKIYNAPWCSNGKCRGQNWQPHVITKIITRKDLKICKNSKNIKVFRTYKLADQKTMFG